MKAALPKQNGLLFHCKVFSYPNRHQDRGHHHPARHQDGRGDGDDGYYFHPDHPVPKDVLNHRDLLSAAQRRRPG